jgi:basic membrane protein A and related proteins
MSIAMLTATRKQAIIWGLIAAVASLVLVGVVSSAGFNSPRNSSVPLQSLRVAVLTDALFDDGGWGSASSDAADMIRNKYDIEVVAQDNVSIADIEATLERYAEAKFDLIIAHGVQWGDPSVRVGQQFRDVKIVVFTGLVESQNVASVFPKQQEGSFLLGALAGMMTKTGVVAYVGGEEYPNVINVFEGFKHGAKTANPDVRIVGTYLNDWDNPPKGKEVATSLIRQQNADVIFHVADSSGRGVIEAAEHEGVYALGAVQDQNLLAPKAVLSSFVLDVDKAYDSAVQSVVNGTFEGRIARPGIEPFKGAPGDGIVYIAPFHSLDAEVPSNVKSRLNVLTSDLLDERLVVPERLEAEVQ